VGAVGVLLLVVLVEAADEDDRVRDGGGGDGGGEAAPVVGVAITAAREEETRGGELGEAGVEREPRVRRPMVRVRLDLRVVCARPDERNRLPSKRGQWEATATLEEHDTLAGELGGDRAVLVGVDDVQSNVSVRLVRRRVEVAREDA